MVKWKEKKPAAMLGIDFLGWQKDLEGDDYLKNLGEKLQKGEISEEEYDRLHDEYYQGGDIFADDEVRDEQAPQEQKPKKRWPWSKKKNADEGVRMFVSPSFERDFDNWIEAGKPDKKQLFIGYTSKALQSIKVPYKQIVMDTSKINTIQREHLGMSDDVMRQVPQLIENPILVMESKTQVNRITMLGEVYNDNGIPVMAVLELLPTSRNNLELDQINVANAYGKGNRNLEEGIEKTQSLIDSSRILYVEPDKKRTNIWLSRNKLQLPLGITKYGSIGIISLTHRNSQGNFSFQSKNECRCYNDV